MTDKIDNDKRKRLTAVQKVAATAGAIAAISPATEAASDIVYVTNSGINQDLFTNNGASTDWDIDGDGPAEFSLWVRASSFFYSDGSGNYSSNNYYIIHLASRRTNGMQLNGGGFVGPYMQNASGIGVNNLNLGVTVGPTLAGYNWGASNQSVRSALRYDRYQVVESYTNVVVGNTTTQVGNDFNGFAGPFSDGFIGFRFFINGQLHYGWAELSFDGDEISINRWAYEDVAGVGIRVGQTSNVPEPGSLGVLGLGAAGVLAMRRRKKEQQAK